MTRFKTDLIEILSFILDISQLKKKKSDFKNCFE